MSRLKTGMESGRSWWQAASPTARALAAGSVVAITALVAVSLAGLWPAESVPLFEQRSLTRDELGAMQIAFGKSGLNDYEIREAMFVIPRSLRASYLKSLADHNAIPADLDTGLERNSGLGFLQSRSQQRQEQLDRKKQLIREMVQQLGFVEKAIVDYDETPGRTPFDESSRTAIVTVVPIRDMILAAGNVSAIRDTVCGAIAGLPRESVTIIDIGSNTSWVGEKDPAWGDELQPQTVARLQEEDQYEKKIRHALAAYPGVRVNVDVVIDPVVRRVRDQHTIEGQSIPVVQTVQNSTTRNQPGTSPTVTQFAANASDESVGANGFAKLPELGAGSITQTRTETLQTTNGSSRESVEAIGMTVEAVRVSIGIPEQCVRYLAGRQPSDRASLPAFGTSASGNASHTSVDAMQLAFERIRSDILQKIRPLLPGTTAPLGTAGQASAESGIAITIDPDICYLEEPSPVIATTTPDRVAWSPWYTLLLALGVVVGIGIIGPRLLRSRAGDAQRDWPDGPAPADRLASASNAATGNVVAMQQHLDQWCRNDPQQAVTTIQEWLERKAG